jgi:rubrerythrin
MPKSLSKTPAPKKDRIYGSDKNKVGSASSKASAKGIELNESILATLSQKAKDYNESHPKNKVSVTTLKAVMRRGMGAYSTSHRPTITGGAPNSRQAWGFARVNKFLKKKAGQQVKAAYVQDDDLMADGGEVKKFAFIEKWEGGFYWLITKDGDNNYYNVDGDKRLSVVKDMAKRWGYDLVTKKQYEKMLSDSKLADGGETKKSKEAYTIVGVYTSTNDLGREESEDLTKEGLLGYRLRYNKMPKEYYGYVVYDDSDFGRERAKEDYEKYNRGAAAEKERKKARDLENKIKREKQKIIDAQKLEAAKTDDTPKPAYLMTKSEYEDRVVPLLKEYEKFARKNDKYLSFTTYSGFYKVTFEQVLSRGLDGKKTGYYFRSNDEKQLIENWNERKFRKYEDPTIPAPTPTDILEKNIAFFKDLNKFFDEKVIFDGLTSEYKKSNKSEIRRAIEDDTYKKMIENSEITEDEVIKIAEEQGVKVPKKVFSQESLLKKEAKKQMDEILSKIPKMNQDVFKSLYKQLFEDFKDVEKIVIERETERFEGLIKEYIELSQKEGGVNVEKLQTAIVFWRDIFIESQPRVVKTKDYRGYPIIENFYKDLELKSNYKPIMDKIILDYAESLKYRFLKAVLDNFPRVSKPISDVSRESLKVGKKGFEGRYRFNFADGSYFDFVTEAIPAAGYNIVSFHYRYITHLENATLADGTKIKGYYEIMQNFSSDSMADGGSVGQEITCVNCGWHWNTSDSDESDKYICHKCGFDNRTFYDPEPIGFMANGGAADDFKRIKKEYLGIDESFEDTEYKYKDASIHYSKLDKLWILNMQHDGKPQKTIGGYKTLKAAKEVAIYYLSNPKMYADGGLIVSPTENLIESVRKEREKKIAEWYKLGSKIVVARNDGYSYKKESERDSDFFESKNPSQRKVLEIIKDNPDLTEISFNGTIKVGDKVGEELEIVDDFSVVLWKKDSSFFKEGLKFEFVNDNGKYINTIVNKNDTITYKDRKEDGNYIYIKQLDKKYGTISESRSRKDILKEEFDKQEAVLIKDNYADGGVTEDGVHLIIKNINKENMYGGTYKKIFDVIESDVEFYNPYGTEYEELKGNDLHIFITPRPDGHILEKIAKIKDVEFLDSKYADGGATDFGKVVSASSRFRPMETIVFDPPLVGLNGAKLISYTWSFQWETSFSKLEGEAISKRTSDWTQAEISAETGRDIVHKYTIQMPNGDLKVVSSDSVPILLGYTDRAQKSSFPNLSNAAKTLAKQKLQLSIIEAKAKEKADAIAEIVAKGIPEVRVEEGGFRGYKFIIGDSVCLGDDPNDKERLECPKDGYIKNRLKEMGIDVYKDYNTYDLKNRIERQERKIKDILNGKTTAEMGMEIPSQHDLIKMELGLELFKPSKTIDQIAKEKDVPLDYAEEQLRKGMRTESEHSDNPIVQETIALQHLDEMIDYYEKLEYMENQNKMAQGGVTEFYKQYQDWYKNGVSDKMTIMVSIPNAFSKMSSEDNHVILDVFEKRDESVDGKERLKELLELADKNEIDVYLEPIPRHNHIKDSSKKEKITREYLISYYKKFGFELMPNGFMVRKHKNNKMEKGGYYKAGGEINPDDKSVKDYFSHGSGNVGGVLVGKRHSEGGIKAVNKSTNQPLEMEGGEVVITRNAVSDDTKREFEGKMMTNREILSKINESGGGVSFADGGDIPESIYTSGKEYKYGGKMMKDHEIVSSCGCKHSMAEGGMVKDANKLEIGDKIKISEGYQGTFIYEVLSGARQGVRPSEIVYQVKIIDSTEPNDYFHIGKVFYKMFTKRLGRFSKVNVLEKGGYMADGGETDYQTELKNHLFPKVEVEVEVETEMELMPTHEHYITADDLGLSDGMPMLAVGTIVYSSGGNDQWEVVSFSDDGVNLVNKPKSPLQSKMEDKHLTFEELSKYFKDKSISIKNISTERELEPAIALVKNKLPQKSFAVGGFIDGDEDEDAKIMQSQFGKSNFK